MNLNYIFFYSFPGAFSSSFYLKAIERENEVTIRENEQTWKKSCFDEKEIEIYFEVVWNVIKMYQKWSV